MGVRWVFVIGGAVVVGALLLLVWPRFAVAPVSSPEASPLFQRNLPADLEAPVVSPALVAEKVIRAQDIPGVDSASTFTATIPSTWEVEAVAGSQAISFYDPVAAGDSLLDKSQIFIRSFTARDFLTLSTVTIHSRQPRTINGQPAVRYDIEKKQGIPVFPHQPAWRNGRHIVTDIRVSDANPSVFYVIAKRPDLSEASYEAFLQSLIVDSSTGTSGQSAPGSLISPADQFQVRVTKKPFGIHIIPATSPVQPERFSGYHTGADAEYGDVTEDVPVHAIADGTVALARAARGYGGVTAIRHIINSRSVIGIYGHLRPNSLPDAGASVTAGQQIGVLGTGLSPETDGERKHLHFALVKGDTVDLRGYVASQAELARWLDPLGVGL